MSADGAAPVDVSALITVDGHLHQSVAHDRAGVRRDLLDRRHLAASDPGRVLRRHVEVLFEKFRSRSGANTGWLIQLLPGVGTAGDEIAQEHSGDGSVGHPHAGIARGDIDIRSVSRVPADKGQTVLCLHHLSGPAELHLPRRWEMGVHPCFETLKPRVHIVGLRRLVVLSADDEQVDSACIVAPQLRVGSWLHTHVVIRIGRVPEERGSDATRGKARRDDVGGVRRLLGVNREPVVEGGIGRDDN